MPNYTFKNTKTQEVKELFLSLSDREEFLKDPDWVQSLSVPEFISGRRDVHAMADESFKDLKRSIKAGAGKNNTINI